jgi:hypothetical protein
MESEFHDPFGESGQRGLEKLMALGVLAEAGSRLAAERARIRAAGEQQRLERERAAQAAGDKARRLAQAAQSRRDREWMTLAADPVRLGEHVRRLPVQEVARHWGWAVGRTTATGAGSDGSASVVAAACEQELRRRWPALMTVFDQARRDGSSRPEAMAAAARYAFFGGARPHGATVHAPGGGLPVLDAELERQLRRHADGLDAVARRRWLQALQERGWSAESLAWVQDLLRGGAAPAHAAGGAGPVGVARLSFATPAEAGLRPAGAQPASVPPVPGVVRTSGKGPGR